MAVEEFILYSYPDQLISETWLEWTENALSKKHDETFSSPTGFQDFVGRTNSNNRTRALECFRIGFLKGPVVSMKATDRGEIPLGWRYVQEDRNPHTRIGYFAYILGNAIAKEIRTPKIERAFSALCALLVIQMGINYNGKSIIYPALFEKLKQTFPKPNGIDVVKWLRFLSAGMFSTIKSEQPELLLSPYINNKPILKILFIWNSGERIEVTPKTFPQILNDTSISLTDISPIKHSLFWIGSDISSRGVYSKAIESNSEFINNICQIEWDAYLLNSENPLDVFLRKNPSQDVKCIFEELKKLGNIYPNILQSLDNIMKSIIEGVKESLNFLEGTTTGITRFDVPNTVYYGPPGTGKSYLLEEIIKSVPDSQKDRITFHPDYDNSCFVGGYKPITETNSEGKEEIKYKFVPQIFTDVYVKAWKDIHNPYYLIVEEINRGNCAEIFGDLFQLLDRNSNYSISPSREMKEYLQRALGENHDGIKGGKMRLPSNLYLFATMNTSDQSLFPMDSAFKRRWSWQYVPINYDKEISRNESAGFIIKLSNDRYFKWIEFIESVNRNFIKPNSNLGEDKCIGNYFIKPFDREISLETFINKAIFYLWIDVFKDEEDTIFIKNSSYEDFFPIQTNGLDNVEKLLSKVNVPIYNY